MTQNDNICHIKLNNITSCRAIRHLPKSGTLPYNFFIIQQQTINIFYK
uniref:Uncharacterized protein n=1 Tax=Siphoviridae sp. ctTnV63 TaxID=2825523 RepID=A0A8S5NUW9_9CAUD|nr:MAG TPA: hypothetical protein [Siphoviridae sp. ctTnV63]